MLLGILKCDHVREHLRPRFGDYPDMFQALLTEADPGLRFRVYDAENGELPGALDECNAYLLTGSRWGVYDDHGWIDALSGFLRRAHVAGTRIVGICFGHQLLAEALGGRAEKSDRGWGSGVAGTQMCQTRAWMEPALDELSLIVSHQDQVTEMPPGAECLGGSEFCPYAVMSIGDNVLSFQGHPEFSHELSRALIEMREDTLGPEVAAAGYASLATPTQERTVAAWIVRFLRDGT